MAKGRANGKAAKKPATTIRFYKSYDFGGGDHDPVLDEIATAIGDDRKSYSAIALASGVSIGTMRNWELRKTKRPQFATVNAVARAMGREFRMVKIRNK